MNKSMDRADPATVTDQAETVVLSYRAAEQTADSNEGWVIADSPWIQDAITAASYRRYLRHAHAGPVSVGEEWAEFVNCGCASPMDIILRVESVAGGRAIGDRTEFEFSHRSAYVEDATA